MLNVITRVALHIFTNTNIDQYCVLVVVTFVTSTPHILELIQAKNDSNRDFTHQYMKPNIIEDILNKLSKWSWNVTTFSCYSSRMYILAYS